MKARLLVGTILVLAVAAGAAVYSLPRVSAQPDEVPTTHPIHGDLQVRVHALGELGPKRSMTVSAPSIGSRMQMVVLAPAGTAVHQGDVVLAFDPAEQQYNLQQATSELAEADEQLIKLKADALVQASQDQLNLLHARHELRRAEIAVTGNEFVGTIEAKKNDLGLEEARRTLAQIEDDVKTHGASSRAALEVAAEKRGKSQIAADFARKNIESMTVRAPLDGLVVVQENRDAAGGFFFEGMTLPDYKVGDLGAAGRHDCRDRRRHRDGDQGARYPRPSVRRLRPASARRSPSRPGPTRQCRPRPRAKAGHRLIPSGTRRPRARWSAPLRSRRPRRRCALA